MYFSWLHKKTPENCSIKVLKKSFYGRFRVLEYFSNTRNDQNFLFSRALPETYIRMNLCILVWTHEKTTKNCSIKILKKSFYGRFRVLEYFSTTRNDQIFLFSRTLPETYIRMNLCILVDYTKKYSKNAVPMTSNKIFWVVLRFSNFFRLLETTEIFFYLGVLERASWA